MMPQSKLNLAKKNDMRQDPLHKRLSSDLTRHTRLSLAGAGFLGMLSDKPLRRVRVRQVTVRVHQGIHPTGRRWKITRLVAVTEHIHTGIQSTVSAPLLHAKTDPTGRKLSLASCRVYRRQGLQTARLLRHGPGKMPMLAGSWSLATILN